MRLPSSAASSSSTASSPLHLRSKLPQDPVYSNKSGYPLQRGSACLSCRKRKMKCDAEKPVCGQCLKANRTHDCDYDNGKSKSRTQILQEKVTMLESRLRELEGSPALSHNSALPLHHFPSTSSQHTPDFYNGNGASERIYCSSSSSSLAVSEDLPWDLDPMSITPNDLLNVPGRWWDAEHIPPRIQRYLIDIFLPHRQQCGFEADVNCFLSSLTSSNPPHPSLLFAIYALACHFSHSPVFASCESRFVSRSLHSISYALEASDSLADVLQASCLLAVLFFAKGRLLEGYYHAGATTRLAVGLGLHQITTPEWLSPPNGASPPASTDSAGSHSPSGGGGGGSILAPPADVIELGERILAFWQVYNLDRCWESRRPPPLSEDKFPRTKVEPAWPRLLEEYEMGQVVDTDFSSMNYLYSQVTTVPYNGDSTHTLS